jgi:ubiquinone/menaquinone biosynthesis C-methylase UbiE
MYSETFTIPANTFIPENAEQENDFEAAYIALRKKEQRIYSDEMVLNLPDVPDEHPHYTEWLLRKRSAKKLVQWLQKKQQPLQILETGCGNGWLSKQLSTVWGSNVIGNDINFTELQQAANVFSSTPNLHFIYGDIRSGLFKETCFDCIIFAASIQYFPSLKEIISTALSLLKTTGELHILDTPFYKDADVNAAQKRTAAYYTTIGFDTMAAHYFHHTWNSLQGFDYELLYNPSSLLHYFSKDKNPFPWICIKPQSKPA